MPGMTIRKSLFRRVWNSGSSIPAFVFRESTVHQNQYSLSSLNWLTWALASPADTSLASPPFHPSTRQGLICRPETVKDKCGGEESLDHGSSTNIGIEEETKSCLEELEDLGGEGMAEETSLGT